MRNFLTAAVLLVLSSCLSEKGVKPTNGTTFVRYYNGGNNDEAIAFEQTSDGGYILLISTRIQKAEADLPAYKIKMIRTDGQGNPKWTRLYPDFTDKTNNYSAASLQILGNGGYVVVGNDIQSDGSNKLLVMTVDDATGDAKKIQVNTVTPSVTARAIAINSKGNYFVLGVMKIEEKKRRKN